MSSIENWTSRSPLSSAQGLQSPAHLLTGERRHAVAQCRDFGETICVRLGGVKNSSSRQLLQFRLRLLQPVRHAHLAVHRRRGGEVLLRLLAFTRASVELPEAEVAVGDEGAHAKLIGQIEGLAIEALCLVEVC